MNSKDLVVGEHYAYSNQRSGNRYMQRVKVLEIGVEISSGYYGKAHNGVLVDFLDKDGVKKGTAHYANSVVRPGSLHWPWAKEIEYRTVKDATRAEHLEKQEVRGVEVKALVELVNQRLGETAFVVRGNGRSWDWGISNKLQPEELAALIVNRIESK